MSNLTKCNYHTLKGIDEDAKARGAKVRLKGTRASAGEEPWIAVYVSDKPEPVAYLLELTTECAC